MKKYYGYVDSVKAEFGERVFSSRKRVIKFIAICFVPFLYAFVCIWAFWNPIPKIGSAPMAIISNDMPIDTIAGATVTGDFAFGEAYSYYTDDKNNQTIIDDTFNWDATPPSNLVFVTTASTEIPVANMLLHKKMSLVDNLVNAWKSGSVENISYNSSKDKFKVKVNDNMTLTNLKYLTGDEAAAVATTNSDGTWNVKDQKKYWVQAQMPKNLSKDFIGYLDATLQNFNRTIGGSSVTVQKSASDFLTDLKQNNIQFWSTYKHNFLFGQFMYIFNEFKSSLLVDMGPQVIMQLVSLIMQDTLNNAKAAVAFTAPETVDEILTGIADHGSTTTHSANFQVTKGTEYVIRNQEMLAAIKAQHSTWTLPPMSIEGTTGTSITSDWGTDGFLSLLAKLWNLLMNGSSGDLIALTLSAQLTQKINDSLPPNLGTITIDAAGVKKLFSTAGNIAGFLEQSAALIPETDANFAITATGAFAGTPFNIKDYKSFMALAAPILRQQFGLVSILSSTSSTSPADISAYVIPFGSTSKPQKGTFVYNLESDFNTIMSLVFNDSNSQNKSEPSTLAENGFFPNLAGIVKTNIVGSQYNPYGIGLGQFFLCIGIWVGTLMQTFIYDRAKRVKKATPWAWYLSKTTLMLATAWIQTTVLMIAIYALGWSAIGASFGLMYLWMMFTATVFVFIQQALWYSVQDETIGKFLVIVLLIISLSSGWGTFPTFMQSPFFNVLSYITPYTYSIHGQGAIIYSIATGNGTSADSLYIMQQFGFLIIWIALFLGFGMLAAYRRNRDMLYGTHRSKRLAEILLEQEMNQYVDHKTKKVKWNKLPKEEMADIRKKVKHRYPEEGQFQWYKRWKAKNHPEKPLTASESDDETMARSD